LSEFCRDRDACDPNAADGPKWALTEPQRAGAGLSTFVTGFSERRTSPSDGQDLSIQIDLTTLMIGGSAYYISA